MHRPLLLYSLSPPYWSRRCLCYSIIKRSQNPKISTRSLSHEILVFWTIHRSWKKFFLNQHCINLRSSSLSYHACTLFHYTLTCRLYFYSHIFAVKLDSWIFIHLCLLWKDITFFKS